MALMMFLPGTLVFRALHPRGRNFECMAIAPPLSLAVTFLLGEVTTLTGLPFGPPALLVVLTVLGVAAFASRRRSRDIEQIDVGQQENPRPVSRQAGALLVAGSLFCGITWLAGLHGVATTPPKRDSANHGIMAARIAHLETMDSVQVLASDIPGGRQQSEFYPLALHGEVALAHRLAGIPIADGLLAATILFAALVFPVGLFMFVRYLVPEDPRVAGMTSLLLPAVGFFPFFPIDAGAMTLIAGIAMIPASCVVMARYLVAPGRREGAIVTLITIGTFATHSSELALLFIIAALLLGEAALRSGTPRLALTGSGRALKVLVLAVVFLVPVLGAVAGGAAERSAVDDLSTKGLGPAVMALGELVSFPLGPINFLVLLAIGGIAVSVARRRHLAMTCFVLSMIALYLIASTLEGPLELLTLPWYHQASRLAYNLVLLVPFFAAIALGAAAPRLGRVVHRYLSRGSDGLAAVTVIAALLGIIGCGVNAVLLHLTFEKHALVDRDALAAFGFLSEAVEPGERVLNDRHAQHEDGAMWMYPFYGVAPLFTLEPAGPEKSWDDRLWLLDHLPELRANPRVSELLDEFDVRFVYLNDALLPTGRKPKHRLHIEELSASAGFCERFRQGTSHVFEVLPSGSCT